MSIYEPEFDALGFDFLPFNRDCEKAVGATLFTPAICVRREKFKILEHREIKGNSVCEKYDDGTKEFKNLHKDLFKRPGYIMLCLVEHLPTSQRFAIGNVHFAADKTSDFVRQAHALLFMQEATNFC